MEVGPGRWMAFEIKLGLGRIDDAARSLLKFADRVDTSRSGEPIALGVIVERGYGYVRPDGVSVIPLGALGPLELHSPADERGTISLSLIPPPPAARTASSLAP